MSGLPRLAECLSEPPGHYADNDLGRDRASTNCALVLQDVLPGDIREIQGGEEVAGGGVEENNEGWRREGGRC